MRHSDALCSLSCSLVCFSSLFRLFSLCLLDRKNWTQSWTVLHGGVLTFHKDPKSAPAGNAVRISHTNWNTYCNSRRWFTIRTRTTLFTETGHFCLQPIRTFHLVASSGQHLNSVYDQTPLELRQLTANVNTM